MGQTDNPAVEGFADSLQAGAVRCKACQRFCSLEEGEPGWCGVRMNRHGKLVPLSYGRAAVIRAARVERKPLFHFHPGKLMLSVGGLGCNFRCPGCQNFDLAHADVPGRLSGLKYVPPQRLVGLALAHDCIGISFTYNEPAVWFEYTLDTFRLARAKGLKTNYVTNGSLSPQAMDKVAPFLDAYRVDIKGFSDRTYGTVANFSGFRGVLEVAESAKSKWDIHVECVTNVIPTVNDGEEELRAIAAWMADTLGPETPWHVTRFVPHGGMSHLPHTPVSTLERARRIGMNEGLSFVYIGNVPGHTGENTYCPECGALLIERAGLEHPKLLLEEGACPGCGYRLAGSFE